MTITSAPTTGGFLDALARVRDALARPTDRARASRAAATAFTIRLCNAVLAYLTQIVLARLMGAHDYGIYASIWVWLLIGTSLAALGFAESAVHFIPKYRETGRFDELRGFLRFGVRLVAVGSTLIAGGAALAVWLARDLIGPEYVLPVLLMILSLPLASLQSWLEGVGRAHLWTGAALLPVYVLRHGLILVVTVWAVKIFGLDPSAAVAFGCVVVAIFLSFLFQSHAIATRLRGAIEDGPAATHRRAWVRGSVPFALTAAAAQMFSFADVIALSMFVEPAAVAVYFAATRVVQLVGLFPYATSVGSTQLFAAAHAVGDAARLRRLVHEVTFWNAILTTVAVVGVLAIGPWLLLVFGRDFAAGYPALAILTLGLLARALCGPGEDILNMTGHGRWTAISYAGSAMIAILLVSALAVPFGIEGAAVAMSTAFAIRSGWLALLVRRHLGFDCTILSARASLSFLESVLARFRGGGSGAERATPAE